MAMGEILSYDDYARIEHQGLPHPYILEARRGNQHMLFYGSQHITDPSHPQFADIEDRWSVFIREATTPIALVEGRHDEVPFADTADRAESMSSGESRFTVYLARRDGIPVASPEPPRTLEAETLARQFGHENVVLFYFVRQLEGWLRQGKSQDYLLTEGSNTLQLMKQTLQWDDIDFSLSGMQALHAQVFQKPLDPADKRWLYDLITPATDHHVTNQLARASGDLRDAHILSELEKYWHNGRSLFIVYGSAHAIRMEPALRRLTAGLPPGSAS